MQLYTKILLAMLIGVILGVTVGPNSVVLPKDTIKLTTSTKIFQDEGFTQPYPFGKYSCTARIVSESSDHTIGIEWTYSNADILDINKDKALKAHPAYPDGGKTKAYDWLDKFGPRLGKSADVERVSSRLAYFSLVATEWVGLLFGTHQNGRGSPRLFLIGRRCSHFGRCSRIGPIGGRTIGYFFLHHNWCPYHRYWFGKSIPTVGLFNGGRSSETHSGPMLIWQAQRPRQPPRLR